MGAIRISSVTFEHHPTGFGIGHARPRISWRFEVSDGADNWVQESCDIEIGTHNDQDGRVYHVESTESVLVPWPGSALQSRESAWVKVRSHGKATDNSGFAKPVSTGWSSPANVEAALLDKADWSASLIASTITSGKEEPIPPVLLRKAFSLPEQYGQVAKARLYITAHGIYEAFVNGQRVGEEQMAPGWTSYDHRLLYQTFDVTSSLTGCKPNVLGVELGEGWFAGRLGWEAKRHFYGGRLAVLAQLEISFASGESMTVLSDGTWKSHKSATIRSEIYNGEDYDSRKEQQGWNKDAQFDDLAWTATEELSFPSASLIASDTPPVRIMEKVTPVKFFKSDSGKTLIDLGQNLVGKLEVRLPESKTEGHRISFSHAEVLERGELGTRPLREAKPIDSVVLSQRQPAVWCPKFTFHGFRYVQVDGWPDSDGMPGDEDIAALVMYSGMTRTGWFSCSDSLVNRLHENVVWSMKGNFLSIPTDCPQRDERLGWTGDIQVFAPSASFLFDTSGFLDNWLQDLAAEQLEPESGGVPGLVIPNILKNSPGPFRGGQAVWHDVSVLTPWDLYNASGDVEVLRRQYDSMKAWVDQGIEVGPNGLWDQNIWQLADWLDPAAPPDEPGSGRTDNVLVADAYLVRVLETISKISSLIGEKEDSDRYHKRAVSARKAFEHEYITPSGLLVGDTQTAHALALSFRLFNSDSQTMKSASRLAHLVHHGKYRIATGFAGTPIITHALSETGNHQLAYKMLLERKCPSWLYPITMGATTIWERWDSMLPDGSINPGSMTSFNHYALGAVANWLHKFVGGISPLSPGWRKFMVQPTPGGTITSANVSYEGPYGRIECSWEINNTKDVFNMTVVVPPNSQAMVVLPSDQSNDKERWIGSGKHQFTSPIQLAEWPPKSEFKRSTFGLDLSEKPAD